MGAWGAGLYANDTAADLKATVAAVVRLPFDSDQLVRVLREFSEGVSEDTADEDYSSFWLVLADQFHKRGIPNEKVRQTAIEIIDRGFDIAMMESLGMGSTDLRKRRGMLAKLRVMIEFPPDPKARKTLSKPEPLIMLPGEVWAYPTRRGMSLNPYFPAGEQEADGWISDGWCVICVAEAGSAFGYLSWYRGLFPSRFWTTRPNMEDVLSPIEWWVRPPGTCSANHLKKLKMERIGRVVFDEKILKERFVMREPSTRAAVHDISIANSMAHSADSYRWVEGPDGYTVTTRPAVESLREVIRDGTLVLD